MQIPEIMSCRILRCLCFILYTLYYLLCTTYYILYTIYTIYYTPYIFYHPSYGILMFTLVAACLRDHFRAEATLLSQWPIVEASSRWEVQIRGVFRRATSILHQEYEAYSRSPSWQLLCCRGPRYSSGLLSMNYPPQIGMEARKACC